MHLLAPTARGESRQRKGRIRRSYMRYKHVEKVCTEWVERTDRILEVSGGTCSDLHRALLNKSAAIH